MKKGLFFLLIFVLSGCFMSNQIMYSEGFRYDSKEDVTKFDKVPLGYVDIPGKWEKQLYNTYSKQQFFKNADSVTIAIAFWPKNRYEMYKRGGKEITFLKSYYERNIRFIGEQAKGKWTILKADSMITPNYMVCKFYSDSASNSYYLYGIRYNSFYNIKVEGEKWGEQKTVEFLEKVFVSKR